MSILIYLLALAISGLFVGAFGRLALPGPDPMSIPQTILIGLAGSFLAGLLVYAISGGTSSAGIILSIAMATFLVYLVRRRRGGTLSDPGPRGRR